VSFITTTPNFPSFQFFRINFLYTCHIVDSPPDARSFILLLNYHSVKRKLVIYKLLQAIFYFPLIYLTLLLLYYTQPYAVTAP